VEKQQAMTLDYLKKVPENRATATFLFRSFKSRDLVTVVGKEMLWSEIREIPDVMEEDRKDEPLHPLARHFVTVSREGDSLRGPQIFGVLDGKVYYNTKDGWEQYVSGQLYDIQEVEQIKIKAITTRLLPNETLERMLKGVRLDPEEKAKFVDGRCKYMIFDGPPNNSATKVIVANAVEGKPKLVWDRDKLLTPNLKVSASQRNLLDNSGRFFATLTIDTELKESTWKLLVDTGAMKTLLNVDQETFNNLAIYEPRELFGFEGSSVEARKIFAEIRLEGSPIANEGVYIYVGGSNADSILGMDVMVRCVVTLNHGQLTISANAVQIVNE